MSLLYFGMTLGQIEGTLKPRHSCVKKTSCPMAIKSLISCQAKGLIQRFQTKSGPKGSRTAARVRNGTQGTHVCWAKLSMTWKQQIANSTGTIIFVNTMGRVEHERSQPRKHLPALCPVGSISNHYVHSIFNAAWTGEPFESPGIILSGWHRCYTSNANEQILCRHMWIDLSGWFMAIRTSLQLD